MDFSKNLDLSEYKPEEKVAEETETASAKKKAKAKLSE